MSKLTKLLKSPGPFLRDYFQKRYPEVVDKSELAEKPGLPPTHLRHDEFDPYPPTFPIDVVYTWVDGSDEEWLARKLAHQSADHAPIATNRARFECKGELRYSLRSLEQYAPWINHIYIVTDQQVPEWLNTDHPKITVIDHREIIPSEFLPTFNSHVIEAHLYRIPGLSEHFIYFNDDVMLTRPVTPGYFFSGNGNVHLFGTRSETPAGEPNRYDTPTQQAAKGVRKLLEAKFGVYMRYSFAHTFHPQLKSTHEAIRECWPQEIEGFLGHRFRSTGDLAIATYLAPNFSYLSGKADFRHTTCMYFNVRSRSAKRNYQLLMQRKDTGTAPFSMCLNDVQPMGDEDDDAAVQEREFLDAYYRSVSGFERD